MNVTGVGSSFNFIYDKSTKKISTKDGSKNEFVDYFNGDITETETESLNFYDRNIKLNFEHMLQMCSWGMLKNSPLCDTAAENEVEIECNIASSNVTEFYVNGHKTLVAEQAVQYTSAEIRTFASMQQLYSTKGGIEVDKENNSITIGSGSVIEIDKNHRYKVLPDNVVIDGDYNALGRLSRREIEERDRNSLAIDRLIRFADQQQTTKFIPKESMSFLLGILEKYGVDTSREFSINGTKCVVDNFGQISEVDKPLGPVPRRIHQAALKRYEESMLISLKDYDWSLRKA